MNLEISIEMFCAKLKMVIKRRYISLETGVAGPPLLWSGGVQAHPWAYPWHFLDPGPPPLSGLAWMKQSENVVIE